MLTLQRHLTLCAVGLLTHRAEIRDLGPMARGRAAGQETRRAMWRCSTKHGHAIPARRDGRATRRGSAPARETQCEGLAKSVGIRGRGRIDYNATQAFARRVRRPAALSGAVL